MSLTGLSRTSDLYGYRKCHYDVGNIIDHVLQGIQASCLSDVRLAFVGQGLSRTSMCYKAFRHPAYQMPIGSVSIFTLYCKMGRSRIQMRPKARLVSVATFSLFRKCCRNAEGLQRLIDNQESALPLCSGVGEAPRR